ncbi:MAG: urease accessory protein UreF [Coriobacteriales bacterium]|jgi:urease accessory protein|nr:urease accessory protein UreF [Coriobacteriales bacterium]
MHKNISYLLLQVNDATFPIGGYSHSYGLETYIHNKSVYDAASAWNYVRANLSNSFTYCELLPIRLAYEATKARDLTRLMGLERLSVASRTARESRQASLKLGSRFVKTAAPLLTPGAGKEFFETYFEAVGRSLCTHPIAYGVFCAVANIECAEALGTFLYAQTSAMVITCVKTVPLSQTDGQTILAKARTLFDTLVERAVTLGDEDLFRSCPGLEIHAMRHEQLYSRLYMS